MRYLNTLLLSALMLFGTTACVVQKSPVTGSKRAYAYSWQQEIQIGKEVDQEIIMQYGLYDDPEIAEYVAELGQVILANSDMRRSDQEKMFRDTEFFFRVLDSPVINAFALPGGYNYVTRGLLAHMNNEAQLAVVIGHEIGHVAARHASQRALQQTLGQVAVIGGALIGQEVFGLPGQNILDLSSTAAQLFFLKHSRDHERESDKLGVEYAAKTGYAAEEGAAFFTSLKRISENQGQSIPSLLSTHPDPGEREKKIPEMAAEWREQGYEQSNRNTDHYNRMINNMIYGENPREGFVENGVFYHPDLRFRLSVPDQWQLINQRAQVVMVNSDQNAVSIMRLDSESDSPQASVREVISSEGFTILNEGNVQRNDGLNAYSGTAAVKAEDGTDISLNVYSLAFNDNIYRFISYTVTQSFAQYEPVFRSITSSFGNVTDQRILNIKPVRLQSIKTDREAAFTDLMPQQLPMGITIEEMAIVNQVQAGDRIPAGRWIKIPIQ
jgi:predicted Zn-dependent protease